MTILGMPYWLWAALGLCVLEALVIPAAIYLASRIILAPRFGIRSFIRFTYLAGVLPLAVTTLLAWWSAEALQVREAGGALVPICYLLLLLVVLSISFAGT